MAVTLGLKNINLLTQDQYNGVSSPAENELYAVSNSGFGMPSTKYETLTLGASGSKYTAPGNGWFCLAKQSTATGQYIYMGANGGAAPSMTSASYATSGHVQCSIPCLKGMQCQITYTVAGTTAWLRFVYAEGE